MFTALHHDENGNETLWTCTHVRKFTHKDALAGTHRSIAPSGVEGSGVVHGPGVMLDLAPIPGDGGQSNTVFFPAEVPASNKPWRPSGAFIAVMNDHGKTVAKYDL